MYYREELSEILHEAQATGSGALSLHPTDDGDNDLSVIDPRLVRINKQQRLSASSSPAPQPKQQHTYDRSKKRFKSELPNDDDIGVPASKRLNKGGFEKVDLGAAILGLSTTMERAIEEKGSYKTNSQKAVQLLESAYGNRMDLMEFIEASTFFEDERKAGNFLVITDLKRRDRWLEIQLGIELKPEEAVA
jgi:hypothetical protein